MLNSLQLLAENDGTLTVPENELQTYFSDEFIAQHVSDRLITVQNDGPHGFCVHVALTKKGRELVGLPVKRSWLNRLFGSAGPAVPAR